MARGPDPRFVISGKMELTTGATRFRRKLSRLEGMPRASFPQLGGKLELPIHTWHWLLN